jgi:hypothetical protein
MSAGNAQPTLRQATDAALEAYVQAPRLAGIKTPITRRVGLRARLNALEMSHGGEKAAAQAAGVTLPTWRTWKRGGKPAARSLAKVQGAYERDLDAKSQTPRRKRAEARRMAAAGRTAHVVVVSELQWEGYYNGQAGGRRGGPSVASDVEEPPEQDNADAHRNLDFGQVNISSALNAWARGQDAGDELEAIANDEFLGAAANDRGIFLNTYYRGAEVTIT